ncbi:YopX family protein [Trichococcus collinsii]|uniref:Phage uncharacterized protein TIGR01671 n=1 Tax=Trichococcus collinsii TaxID=157076 RepID=A0AB38A3Y5_9LACT|nr:YopX family protein [Trichococcus collinsii]CZR10923.1 yopx protein [Trichococcus collinsii]SEA96023.1 phage uncharacterized protein TIGR01671 [Trichococcus collinsii]
MREIKFRAWDKKIQQFIDAKEIVISDGKIFRNWQDFEDYIPDDGTIDLVWFTGLKDKNGTDIFEGDILTAADGYTGLIGYRAESAQFVGFNIGKEFTEEEFDTLYTVNGSFNSAEVIGNRFENPELLKEDQE